VDEEMIELISGDELAISLNKDSEADLFFKVSYRFK
jgi:hypothetical protein